MTRAEFARHMGVDRSTVTRWIQRGRIAIDSSGRIDVAAAKQALPATESPEPHHQARSAQIAEQKAARRVPPSNESVDVSLQLKRAMAKERQAKAELAAMECDEKAGTLMDRGEMEYVLQDIGQTLRGALESMADRLAPTIAAHGGDVARIHASLDDAARDILNEISDHMRRKADEVMP